MTTKAALRRHLLEQKRTARRQARPERPFVHTTLIAAVEDYYGMDLVSVLSKYKPRQIVNDTGVSRRSVYYWLKRLGMRAKH